MTLALLAAPAAVGIPAIALTTDAPAQVAPTVTPQPDASPTLSPEPTDDPSPSETDDPTEEPTQEPTREPTPSPSPSEDDDDRDDGSDDGDSGGDRGDGDSDGGIDRPGRVDDPSTGNGREGGRSSGPGGGHDWVPRAEGHPDYSDPVPQPPGSQGDDSITPDGGEPTPPAPDEVDDEATQALESDEASAGFPWPIVALVGVGAAAIGFVLFMARRTRP